LTGSMINRPRPSHNALHEKTCKESARIGDSFAARRAQIKESMQARDVQLMHKHSHARCDREDRWAKKLENNPFAVDLLTASQRVAMQQRRRLQADQKRQELGERQFQKMYKEKVQKAMSEVDQLAELRAEKRHLLESQQHLHALSEVQRRKHTGVVCRNVKQLQQTFFEGGVYKPPSACGQDGQPALERCNSSPAQLSASQSATGAQPLVADKLFDSISTGRGK